MGINSFINIRNPLLIIVIISFEHSKTLFLINQLRNVFSEQATILKDTSINSSGFVPHPTIKFILSFRQHSCTQTHVNK